MSSKAVGVLAVVAAVVAIVVLMQKPAETTPVQTASAPAVTASSDTLKLGALIPLTGGLQVYGEVSANGINLAIEEANAAGGVNGAPVELAMADTQANGTVAVDAAQKLVNVNGVSAIIGALSSGATIPVAESVTSAASVPMMSNASTSPKITNLNDRDFLFRTVPSDAYQGVALAKVVNEAGINDVAVIYINNDYGKGLNDAFASAFAAVGGKVTAAVAYEEKQPSYRGEIQNAAAGGSKHLILMAYPDNGGMDIIKQSLETGTFSNFIYTDGMKANEIIANVGAEHLEGGFGTTPEAVGGVQTDAYKEIYKAKHGSYPEKPYSDTAYDAAMIMMLAAEKAGTNDSKAIRDAIRDVSNAPGETVGPGEFGKAKALLAAGKDVNYVGASGTQDFDANGDTEGATYAHWMIKNGQYETVKIFAP